jgi:quercetin dioxygenase-like cupin family protein
MKNPPCPRIVTSSKPFRLLLALVGAALALGNAGATERVFVLRDQTHLEQYVVDNGGKVTKEKSYTEADLPGLLPTDRIWVGAGNVLRSSSGRGRFLLDPRANVLTPLAGAERSVTDLAGRVLDEPKVDETFRGKDSLYAEAKQNAFVAELKVEAYRSRFGSNYRGYFVLERQVFAVTGDHVDLLSTPDGAAAAATPVRALEIPGANLAAVAVSPWREVFLADAGNACVQRIVWRDGRLVTNGTLSIGKAATPSGVAFDARGELFVASREGNARGVTRFGFVLYDFVNWQAAEKPALDLGGSGALDVAVSRPVGFVLSEKTNPLGKLSLDPTNVHHGISQQILVSPQINSETAVVALVEYAPGGHTAVHYHPQMEQMEIVVSGRALWEVGEVEREVGPGDVIFTPRFTKHGYKVIGDQPFKFYQIEWREWSYK